MTRLEFHRVHSYAGPRDTVSVPIVLRFAGHAFDVLAPVDTGASHCLFERNYGERLQLKIEAGERRLFGTAAGPIETFGHLVQIETFEMSFESLVYFLANP